MDSNSTNVHVGEMTGMKSNAIQTLGNENKIVYTWFYHQWVVINQGFTVIDPSIGIISNSTPYDYEDEAFPKYLRYIGLGINDTVSNPSDSYDHAENQVDDYCCGTYDNVDWNYSFDLDTWVSF